MRAFGLSFLLPASRRPADGSSGWTQYLLVVGLWLTLIGLVWFFIVAGAREIESTAETQARNQAQIYADLVEEFVEQTLTNFDQDIKMLRDGYVRGEVGPDLRPWRDAQHARSEIAVMYAVVDANGRLAATSGDQSVLGVDVSDRPHIRFHSLDPSDRPRLSAPVVGRLTGRVSLQLTRRISAPDGAFLGVVVVSLDAAYYDRFFARTRVRDKDVISLMGADGAIRMRSGPVRAADNYSGQPLFERMLREKSGTARVHGLSDGVERFVAFRTLEQYGLIVYVGVGVEDETSILRSGIAYLKSIAWIFTILTGISALAIVIVIKRRHEAAMSRTVVDELSRRMAVIGGLLDRSDALLLAVGCDGRVHFANARCAEFFAEAGRSGGRDVQSMFRFAAEGASDLFLERIRGSEAAPVSFEQDLVGADGEQHLFLWIWSADDKTPADGRSYIGFGIDVTARRRSEMTAIRSERIASLGDIAASIVHELNQPLNVIGLACTNVRHMLAGRTTDEVDRRLDRIDQQVGRAAGILDRLRRYISGSGTSPSSRFALVDAIRAAEEFVADQLRIDAVRVVNRVPPGHYVRGDRLLFEQLIVNLLLNARDAIVSGANDADAECRGEIVVEGGVLGDGGFFGISVTDTGPGLSGEAAARAFEPYFTTKPSGRGTGLGLPICRTIVQAFGGEISIRNGERGACVEFRVVVDRGGSSALAGVAAQ
ncbi:MAG: hypothetical protein JNL71_06305 [Rhodospirillales bacterium]|nr:hypothetical protein [Rhodospirillales bacterium]